MLTAERLGFRFDAARPWAEDKMVNGFVATRLQ